jgi:hypothetical protein
MAEAKPKKAKGPPPPPPVGWYKEEGWSGECFAPPDFEKLGEGDRKMERQKALEAMVAQWSGARDEAVKMTGTAAEDLETVLLGRPQMIEGVARQNRDLCVAFRKGGDLGDWQSAIKALPAKLTVGECPSPPLTYTLFDYLDIGKSWQRPIGLCKGDKALITATVTDKYRVADNAPWITVEGDPSQPKPGGADWPCTVEGCLVGMLVGKFVTEAGVELIFPIGAEKVFVAPEHGTLSWSINDNVWYDNRFFKGKSIEDHTAVTVAPAE